LLFSEHALNNVKLSEEEPHAYLDAGNFTYILERAFEVRFNVLGRTSVALLGAPK